jgi:YidC/Oxa1 family membrane protein insertase
LGAGYKTILRPHPNVINQKPQVINNIKTLFKDDENFQLNLDIRENSSLFESHLMISDWSGVAFEYAFVCERPVIFIDIPKKCNNPETEKITQIPIEVSIRNKVGRIVLPSELHILPKLIEDLHNNKDRFVSGIKVLRQKCVFNFGFSNQIAAERIKEIANKQCQ